MSEKFARTCLPASFGLTTPRCASASRTPTWRLQSSSSSIGTLVGLLDDFDLNNLRHFFCVPELYAVAVGGAKLVYVHFAGNRLYVKHTLSDNPVDSANATTQRERRTEVNLW